MAHTIGRSLRSLRPRCDQQVHSMDGNDSPDSDHILSFDRHVSSLLLSLDDADAGSFLSVPWISKLLRSFLLLLDDFNDLLLLLLPRANLPNCPLLKRLLSDFFDRSVKALDLLNAVRDGLDRVRLWSGHLDIVVPAVADRKLRRARKSLGDLSLLLGETDPALLLPNHHHNRSFGRDPNRPRGGLRTLSWSVSRSWSAARQLQAMGSGLSPPKPADVSGTAGLAVPVFTMGSVLLFVSWALVAAIPCQDRGLQHAHHLPVPRSFPWAAAMASLQEKVLEEQKRRERDRRSHSASGLMREVCVIEKGTRRLIELLDGTGGEGEEVKERVRELDEVREGLKEGLEGLERQVREVFHRIVRSRTEGLDCLSRSSRQ
ncbi:uncharacterized protein M6B38_411975 [Iris pallida]|uniref:Uncharacterized protein n=1 Tax=Iris pallida TaxID=29817 RepID=A0AAX6FMP2_IRIPA|nr:uncharacterized protein M6B38_411975 [Iris pallida]